MHNKFIHGGNFPGWIVGVLLASMLIFSACGSAPPVPAETTSAEPVAEQPTQAVAQVAEPAPTATTATAPTAAADETPVTVDITAPTVPLPAECQAINIPNDERIPAPSAEDWSVGPEDAPLTLIEYGDFQ